MNTHTTSCSGNHKRFYYVVVGVLAYVAARKITCTLLFLRNTAYGGSVKPVIDGKENSLSSHLLKFRAINTCKASFSG